MMKKEMTANKNMFYLVGGLMEQYTPDTELSDDAVAAVNDIIYNSVENNKKSKTPCISLESKDGKVVYSFGLQAPEYILEDPELKEEYASGICENIMEYKNVPYDEAVTDIDSKILNFVDDVMDDAKEMVLANVRNYINTKNALTLVEMCKVVKDK